MIECAVVLEKSWAGMTSMYRAIYLLDELLAAVRQRSRTAPKWFRSPRCPDQLLALRQAAEERHRPHWNARTPPNKVLFIGMVAAIAQEARVLLVIIRNPADWIDMAASRATLDEYAMEKLNATSIGIGD